jgi:cytidylate kinase
MKVSEDEVLKDLRRRDRIDSERSVSPLRPAQGAIIVDSDGLTLEDVVQRVAELVEGSA